MLSFSTLCERECAMESTKENLISQIRYLMWSEVKERKWKMKMKRRHGFLRCRSAFLQLQSSDCWPAVVAGVVVFGFSSQKIKIKIIYLEI